METESRPLSTVAAISLAGLTAAIVIGGGIFVAERGMRPGPAPTASPVGALSKGAEPPAEGKAPAIAEPTTSTTVSASAAAPPVPDELPPHLGYLTVRGQGEARVYVNGVDRGPLNEEIKLPCGLKFVRVGTATDGARPPSWLSPGQSVKIGCRAATEIAAPTR